MTAKAYSYVEKTPQLGKLDRKSRRRFGRDVWRLTAKHYQDGARDAVTLTEQVVHSLQTNPRYTSLLTMILVTVLIEVVKYLVNLWLENRISIYGI